MADLYMGCPRIKFAMKIEVCVSYIYLYDLYLKICLSFDPAINTKCAEVIVKLNSGEPCALSNESKIEKKVNL